MTPREKFDEFRNDPLSRKRYEDQLTANAIQSPGRYVLGIYELTEHGCIVLRCVKRNKHRKAMSDETTFHFEDFARWNSRQAARQWQIANEVMESKIINLALHVQPKLTFIADEDPTQTTLKTYLADERSVS